MKYLFLTGLLVVSLSVLFCNVGETAGRSDLILYFSFDDVKGGKAVDLSGKGNDGVILGNSKTVAGKFGSALEFNGTDSCIEVKDNVNLNPKEITITVWVKLAELKRYGGIVAKWAGTWQGYLLQTSVNHAIVPLIGDGSATYAYCGGIKDIKQDVWYHVAMTWNGTLNFYVDGKEANYDKATSVFKTAGEMKVPADSLFVGKRADNNSFFKGVMDEVMIFNKALSLQEVQATMTPSAPSAVSRAGKLSVTWAALKR